MDSLNAFALGEANRGKEMKVFDWLKAARMIRERNVKNAGAGLSGDWEYTGGEIFSDGEITPAKDTYTYLASTWATPELDIDGKRIDCYLMESDTPGWDARTYWPEEAILILKGEKK